MHEKGQFLSYTAHYPNIFAKHGFLMNEIGVIVDGYSTGAGLVKEFQKYNISCIHVQSQLLIPEIYFHTYEPNNYLEHYIFNENFLEIMNALSGYKIKFIIPGAECGVQLADQLSEAIGVMSNGSELSECRRNKYLMQQQVMLSGINTIPSFRVKTQDELIALAKQQNQWPLVIKPLNSAGGDGVEICYSLSALKKAFSTVLNCHRNMLGYQNDAALVQPFIIGDEYVINTVSLNGKHKLCEIWKYSRINLDGGHKIYDTAYIIDYDANAHSEIVQYAFNCLDALGIKFGPGHIEIIKNNEGCYLVELGARLMGANLPFDLLQECLTTPQALLMCQCYADQKLFNENFNLPYKLKKHLETVFMINEQQTGVIQSFKKISINKIKRLASFISINLAVDRGDKIYKTIDYQTSPGLIYLSHSSQAILDSNKKSIRELEKNLFNLEQINLCQRTVTI
jgi:hypothetical protein